jgi:hypothetical protein
MPLDLVTLQLLLLEACLSQIESLGTLILLLVASLCLLLKLLLLVLLDLKHLSLLL